MNIRYPKLQTTAFSNSLLGCCQQARLSKDEEVVFDLSNTEFITPFGIILLAGTIAECLKKDLRVKYQRPKKVSTKRFLSGIGFNGFFKLSDEQHKIESSHVQLKRIFTIDSLLTDQIVEVFDHALHMSDGVRGSLKLAINEVMTNAFDHSESRDGCYVCAQNYPQARTIRLCIADFGIGLLKRLSPKYTDLRDSHHAIKLAIQEGITTRPGLSGGYGLWHIHRFIEMNEGRMCILSGDGKVVWDFKGAKSKVKEQTMHYPFSGTIINLEINADREGYYFLETDDGQIF